MQNTIYLTTHDGQPLYVISAPPNAKYGSKIEHHLGVSILRSLSGREARRPLHTTPRHTYTATWFLYPHQADALRKAIAEIGTKRFAIPLWHDLHLPPAHATSYYDAQYYLRTDTGTILPAANIPTLSPHTPIAPLLFGYLSERPKIEPHTQTQGRAEITLAEDAPHAWRIDIRPI